MKSKVVICLIVSLIFFGCITIKSNVQKPICETIPSNSYSIICQIANHANKTPEQVASVLRIANTTALAEDLYTAKEAKKFIDGIKDDINIARKTDISYEIAQKYIMNKYNALSKKERALFIIANEFVSINTPDIAINEPLSDFDIDMILKHLDNQSDIIDVFLD